MNETQYPGADGHQNSTYSEKHHFGYRWYDQYRVPPAYPFGFGLSYSSFDYSNLRMMKDKKSILFEVTNTGDVEASEIAQIYIGYPETENLSFGYRSPKVLKGFSKVKDLKPGETRTVEFKFEWNTFTFWDVNNSKWSIDNG